VRQLVFTYNTDKTMREFILSLKIYFMIKKMNAPNCLDERTHIQKRRPVEEFVRLLNESGYSINESRTTSLTTRFVDGLQCLIHFSYKACFY